MGFTIFAAICGFALVAALISRIVSGSGENWTRSAPSTGDAYLDESIRALAVAVRNLYAYAEALCDDATVQAVLDGSHGDGVDFADASRGFPGVRCAARRGPRVRPGACGSWTS